MPRSRKSAVSAVDGARKPPVSKPVAPHRRGKLGGKRPPHRAEDAKIVERRAQSLDLRRMGATYRQIAKALHISVETAYADVQAELSVLRESTTEDATLVRDLELRRLDDYVFALSARAKQGDIAAITTLLRVQERRARYLGLDAPERQQITGEAPVFTLRIDREPPA